jgi:hypothetical protein
VSRIFSVLACLSVLLLAANFFIGLWIGDFQSAARDKVAASRRFEKESKQWERILRDPQAEEVERRRAESKRLAATRESKNSDLRFQEPRKRLSIHWFLGLLSSLMVLLVCSVTITYFVGTSRWCREVVETYSLPAELTESSNVLKRKAFVWSLAGAMTIILVATLGGLADPSAAFNNNRLDRAASFVTWHYLAAMLGLLFIAWSFWIQYSRIAENYLVIANILAEVNRVRKERGLPAEEPASA